MAAACRNAVARAALLALVCITAGCSAQATAPGEKMIIYYGWSSRDTAYVATHWTEMEQLPFDGIGINVAIDPNGRTVGDGSTGNLLGWQTFGPTAFALADFQDAIADLNVPEWQRFHENFLPVSIASEGQDKGLTWFNDARWATIENNWRVLLTIARQGGCRGLLLDPEHYDYPCELFSYTDHRAQRVDKTFAEYIAMARQRGQQLGNAAREIFPNITIALLYGYTLPAAEIAEGGSLESSRYALLPAFLDGLMSGAAAESTFVDLYEGGYRNTEPEQFLEGYDAIKNQARSIAADPLLYDAKMTVGFGLYLDNSPKGKRWKKKRPQRNYFSPEKFEIALRAALASSERYVWIYSEHQLRFFPPVSLPPPYEAAIAAARNPQP